MWTFKNVFALGLFPFGTTFLWKTLSMAGKSPPPTDTAWTLANVLCYVAIIDFAIAAWAVFKEYSWWETPALSSGIVGLIAVVPVIVGRASSTSGSATSAFRSTSGCTSWQRGGDGDRARAGRSRLGHEAPTRRRSHSPGRSASGSGAKE